MKATLFNLVLSQQIGHGFYKQAVVCPFDRFHCYINIPDTNDRDSLFQAEARRCRDILRAVANGAKKERHFCVFDELYSGTNPYEAIGGATAFLRHIARKKRVKFLMTTHFTELCHKLSKNRHIRNRRMEVVEKGDKLLYTYQLGVGVSRIRGGVHILKELGYPASLVVEASKETPLGTY